ncbi:surface-adhesin E family protein [Rhodoferax sp. WC2427]|uniref:surface-adhesin E family protein n=1 Tax=Rhodoferax sp. WC2427 TaxID=3234144 RepID=UPI0034662AF3
MKKPLLLPLLWALACGPALASWVRIATSETSVFYVDSEIPPKVGANVMVWVLRDHTTPQVGPGGPYASSKDQIEVDCAARRVRRIYGSAHPEPMGQGKMVYSEHGPMSWNDVAPKTTMRRVVDMACMHP